MTFGHLFFGRSRSLIKFVIWQGSYSISGSTSHNLFSLISRYLSVPVALSKATWARYRKKSFSALAPWLFKNSINHLELTGSYKSLSWALSTPILQYTNDQCPYWDVLHCPYETTWGRHRKNNISALAMWIFKDNINHFRLIRFLQVTFLISFYTCPLIHRCS